MLHHDHHFNMPPYKLQKTLESKSNISPSDLVKTQLTEGLQKKKHHVWGRFESQGGCGALQTQVSTLLCTALTNTLIFPAVSAHCRPYERDRTDFSDSDNISSWASWKHFTNHPVGQQKAAGLHSLTHSSWRYFSTVSAL